jgi:ribosomal protein S20
MSKPNHSKSSTTKTLEKATKDWRSAKKRERAARNALAAIVNEAVGSGVMSENKVASITAIPRMTIRKMLGKDDLPAEAAATDETTVDEQSTVEGDPAVKLAVIVTDEVAVHETDDDETSADETSADETSAEQPDDEPAETDPSVSSPAFARPVTPTWASPPSSTFTT